MTSGHIKLAWAMDMFVILSWTPCFRVDNFQGSIIPRSITLKSYTHWIPIKIQGSHLWPLEIKRHCPLKEANLPSYKTMLHSIQTRLLSHNSSSHAWRHPYCLIRFRHFYITSCMVFLETLPPKDVVMIDCYPTLICLPHMLWNMRMSKP